MYGIPLSSDPALARAFAGRPEPRPPRHPSTHPGPLPRTRTRTPWRSRFRRRRPDIGPLLQIPSLAHADPRRLAEMVPHTSRLRVAPGRPLVRAGETARELVVVLSGEAVAIGAGGTRTTLGPGAEIGGREALTHQRHPVTVTAVSAVDVVVVAGPSLRWAHAEGVLRWAPVPVPVAADAAGGVGAVGAVSPLRVPELARRAS